MEFDHNKKKVEHPQTYPLKLMWRDLFALQGNLSNGHQLKEHSRQQITGQSV